MSLQDSAMNNVPLVFFILAAYTFLFWAKKQKKTNRYAALSGLFLGLALMTKQIEACWSAHRLYYLIATKRNIRFLFTKPYSLFWGIGLWFFSLLIYMDIRFGSQFWYWYFVYADVTNSWYVESHVGSYLYYLATWLITKTALGNTASFAAGLAH